MPLFRLCVLVVILNRLYQPSAAVRSIGVVVSISERLRRQSRFEAGYLILEVLELCLLALELPMSSLFIFHMPGRVGDENMFDTEAFVITGKGWR